MLPALPRDAAWEVPTLPRRIWRSSLARPKSNYPMPGKISARFGNLHDWSRSTDGPGNLPRTYDVEDAGTVVLGPNVVEPVTDIASKHERVRGGIAALLLVCD